MEYQISDWDTLAHKWKLWEIQVNPSKFGSLGNSIVSMLTCKSLANGPWLQKMLLLGRSR